MMLTDIANIQLIVTMVTKEGQSLLQIMLNRFSVSSLAKDSPVDLILTTTNNLHPVQLMCTRYFIILSPW